MGYIKGGVEQRKRGWTVTTAPPSGHCHPLAQTVKTRQFFNLKRAVLKNDAFYKQFLLKVNRSQHLLSNYCSQTKHSGVTGMLNIALITPMNNSFLY